MKFGMFLVTHTFLNCKENEVKKNPLSEKDVSFTVDSREQHLKWRCWESHAVRNSMMQESCVNGISRG